MPAEVARYDPGSLCCTSWSIGICSPGSLGGGDPRRPCRSAWRRRGQTWPAPPHPLRM